MTRLTAADYARAEQMLAPYRARLVPAVTPQWLSEGARFWGRHLHPTEPPAYRLAPLPEPPGGGLLGS